MTNTIQFVAMEEQDVEALTPIMKRAFDEDAEIHLGREEGGPRDIMTGAFSGTGDSIPDALLSKFIRTGH